VESFLTPHFTVSSRVRESDVPPDVAAMHPDLAANRLTWHRYNVFSIRNSLQWALVPEHPATRHRLLRLEGDRSLDPNAGCGTILKTADAERVRRWIDTTVSAVRDCRVVIITLGLSEVWQDRETGLVMNLPPAAEMWAAFPGRFHFRVTTCAETLHELNEIYTILSGHCADDFLIVVTVSPIPLSATFRDTDVVVANTASKSILRAAADQWTSEHENVHYFPSYEMIVNSHPKGTWTGDFRHCRMDVTKRVMDVFLTEFVTVDR